MIIANLVDEHSACLKCPFETIAFYVPRATLNDLTDEAGAPRVSNFDCTPGTVDPVIANLSAALLPLFQDANSASALFVDYVTQAICARLTDCYGGTSPAALDFAEG